MASTVSPSRSTPQSVSVDGWTSGPRSTLGTSSSSRSVSHSRFLRYNGCRGDHFKPDTQGGGLLFGKKAGKRTIIRWLGGGFAEHTGGGRCQGRVRRRPLGTGKAAGCQYQNQSLDLGAVWAPVTQTHSRPGLCSNNDVSALNFCRENGGWGLVVIEGFYGIRGSRVAMGPNVWLASSPKSMRRRSYGSDVRKGAK